MKNHDFSTQDSDGAMASVKAIKLATVLQLVILKAQTDVVFLATTRNKSATSTTV